MAKKNKNTIYWIIGIIILLLFLMMQSNQQTTIPTNGSSGGTYSAGGGGSSGGGTEDYTGFKFPDFSDLFNFNLPCLFNCGDTQTSGASCTKNSDCYNICANPNTAKCSNGKCSCSTATTTLKSDGESCTDSSQCNSGYCNLGNMAIGKCAQPTTTECTRNTDCDYKCAAANSGVCSGGKCGCKTPTTTTSTCTDTDFGTLNIGSRVTTDINPFEKGTCSANSLSRGLTDSCSNGLLIEYHCRTDTSCDSQTINCATYGHDYICMDGFCTTIA